MGGFKTVSGMVNGLLEGLNITVPVALHLDHGTYEGCYKCIEALLCLTVPTTQSQKMLKKQQSL